MKNVEDVADSIAINEAVELAKNTLQAMTHHISTAFSALFQGVNYVSWI